ncbi:MAG: aminotransferase class III-fold pyridoxal phosphate-dependent enzyme [Paracoccaceae bacterium]|nr:aminotransferase class III-fold pyridoxal phosphate-dependent enzyme [Paracoccaceae bacterium]
MFRINSQEEWVERASHVLPGAGFGNFDPSIFISEGKGSRVWDENQKEYVDCLIGSGPMLLGHGHPEVLDAVFEQLPKGMTFFTNNSAGVELAEEICEAVKCAEQVRYVSSGGEADMYAIRLARAYTGKNKIIKFEGGYHGMSAEAQMSLAPQKLTNFPQAVPDSVGIPTSVQSEVLVAPFNDAEFVKSLITEYNDEVAAIIVEPLQRLIPPSVGFLNELRKQCDETGILLIFDEIVTGFRFAYGGAQEHYNVTPDICTLGKVIGGGFPLAAVVGSGEIMQHFDKAKVGEDGFLMQLGTLSGNPVACVAGLKTMEVLKRENAYEKMRRDGQSIANLFHKYLEPTGIDYKVLGDDTLFDVVFSKNDIKNYRDYILADSNIYQKFNHSLRLAGVFKPPGKIYVSSVLTFDDFDIMEEAICLAAKDISNLL